MISKRSGQSPKFDRKLGHYYYKPPNPPAYKELLPSDFGLKFSDDKLLVRSSYAPVYYSITSLSEKPLTFTIHAKNTPHIHIKPSKATLSKRNRKITVEVISTINENLEIDLLHISEDSACILKVFSLGSEGVELRTAGTDEQFEMSHEFSLKRFGDELEAELEGEEYTAKMVTVLRPTPEVVARNTEILMLKEQENECYVDYPYWVGIAGGEYHTLACTSNGRLYAWGSGIFGQLGVDLKVFEDKQKAILEPVFKKHWDEKLTQVELEEEVPENLKEAIEMRHKMPYKAVSPQLVEVNLDRPVQAVACGMFHSVILCEGTPFSFGLGQYGQLGLGNTFSCHRPSLIELTEKCIRIAAGYYTSFFILQSHTVYSCGDKSEGANGHDSNKLEPTLIPFLHDIFFISSANTHTGAVSYTGSAILFGSNADNKLGGSSPHTMSNIEGEKIQGVYCGGRHTCALTENLEVYAWGYNTSGQLGLSSTMFHSMTGPAKIEYLSGRCVVDISLGWEHSSAITVDGLLYCWGSNSKGQLAIGSLAKEFKRVGLPRLIDHLLGNPVTAISSSRFGSVFITAEAHPEKSSSLFETWKHSLLVEEKHMQELANYRFSLLIRDLKRNELVKKIEEERDREYGVKKRSVKKKERKNLVPIEVVTGPPESYYAFWNRKNYVEKKKNKMVHKFVEPAEYGGKGVRVVTVFGKPKKENTKKEVSLRDVMAFASPEGAELEDLSLSAPEGGNVASAVFEERRFEEPEVKYTASMRYPRLFYPYMLKPNPMLLAPTSF